MFLVWVCVVVLVALAVVQSVEHFILAPRRVQREKLGEERWNDLFYLTEEDYKELGLTHAGVRAFIGEKMYQKIKSLLPQDPAK